MDVAARFADGFFVRLLDDADLDIADLEALRGVDFATAALFAFGRADPILIVRPLTEDFDEDRRAVVRDVVRLMLFVTGLLIKTFEYELPIAGSGAALTCRSLTQLPL